jgi:hypothetical protein
MCVLREGPGYPSLNIISRWCQALRKEKRTAISVVFVHLYQKVNLNKPLPIPSPSQPWKVTNSQRRLILFSQTIISLERDSISKVNEKKVRELHPKKGIWTPVYEHKICLNCDLYG